MAEIIRTTIEEKSVTVRKYQGLPTVFARGRINGKRRSLMLITQVDYSQSEYGYGAGEIAEVLKKKDGVDRYVGTAIGIALSKQVYIDRSATAVWQDNPHRRNK